MDDKFRILLKRNICFKFQKSYKRSIKLFIYKFKLTYLGPPFEAPPSCDTD
jgi:hypothetical protein